MNAVAEMIERVRARTPRLGRELTDAELELLSRYVSAVRTKSDEMNLVSAGDRDRLDRHVLDSLAIAFLGKIPDCAKVLDFGTGAGFPGIVIRIVRPDLFLTLIDSTRKKALFVQHVVRELGLQHIDVIWSRAEDLAADENMRASFDVVTARAAGRLREVVPVAMQFLRSGSSRIITTKSAAADAEIHATRELLAAHHAMVDEVVKVSEDNGGFRLVIIAPTGA